MFILPPIYVLIQSRISKIHHSFRGESANLVAKPAAVGPSKRGKASCRSHVRGKKMVSRDQIREGLRGASQK